MVPEKALPEIDSPTTGAQAPASDDWVAAVRELFAPLGRLAQKLPDFTPRTAQQEMAVAVAHAIATRAILVAEAGTGTGKTFAYLAPALLSGRRTLVSTGTRTLQDQLFHRDLPRLTAALGVPVKRALLKGRNNYVCWFHLERNLEEGRFLEPETVAGCAKSAALRGTAKAGTRANVLRCPKMRWLGPTPPRRATTASAANAPISTTASSSAHAAKRSMPNWSSSTTTSFSPISRSKRRVLPGFCQRVTW
jgi:Rad3-related DNA helicase